MVAYNSSESSPPDSTSPHSSKEAETRTIRSAEGRTTKEIIRCLKRAIAREVYHLITNPPQPLDTTELRPLREAADLTLAQAADALKCSISTLSTIERGHSSNRQTITTYRDYLTHHQHAA